MSLLKLSNVNQSYFSKTILENINLEVQSGEMVAIVGSNGAGKSALLKTIMGINNSNQGIIQYFSGKTKISNTDKQKIGFLYQKSSLDMQESVNDNLILASRLFGFSKQAVDKKIDFYLEKFNLLNKRHKSIKKLSGGEQKLIDIVRVLLCQPKLFLLDEPFNELDVGNRKKAFEIFKDQINNSCGILFTTHLINECLNVDKIIILHEGHIILETPPKDFLNLTEDYLLEFKTKTAIPEYFAQFGELWKEGDQSYIWIKEPKSILERLSKSPGTDIENFRLRKKELSDVYLWYMKVNT